MEFGATGKITKVPISQGAAGTTVLVAGVPGKVLRLLQMSLASATNNATLQIQSKESATNLTGPMVLQTGIGAPFYGFNPEGYVETLPGEGLQIVTTTGAFNGSALVQQILSP